MKPWLFTAAGLMSMTVLVATQSRLCAAASDGEYRCGAFLSGFENLLLIGVLVCSVVFVMALASAIIATAGWMHAKRQTR